MDLTASAASGRRVRGRLVAVALTLSLALNLCFAAGVVWTRLHPPADQEDQTARLHEMAAQLKLTPDEQVAFERYFRTMHARTQLMREEVEPLIADAWSEIGKPQADEARVMRLFDEAAEKRRAFQHDITTQTIAFLATLSPEQRGKFIELAREHRTPWAQHGRHGPPP
jgi:Spy/CpxP family protein refolding chaperone